jgi:hypothetical protein
MIACGWANVELIERLKIMHPQANSGDGQYAFDIWRKGDNGKEMGLELKIKTTLFADSGAHPVETDNPLSNPPASSQQ